MKLEDIKVGETYNVRVLVTRKYVHCVDVIADTGSPMYDPEEDVFAFTASEVERTFTPINPYSQIEIFKMTEIPEEYPKYDPCRKFRKGDRVRLVARNGRNIIAVNWICETNITKLKDDIFTVSEDEHLGYVKLEEMTMDQEISLDVLIPVCFLELVTPVEELEPYFVQENQNVVEVFSIDDKDVPATVFFKSKHKNARERAEAEKDRLNAEHRKEQEWKSNKQDN